MAEGAAWAAGAAVTGGRAITGPAGGLLAMAGAAAGGATMFAPWRGWGTIFRGPCGAVAAGAGVLAAAVTLGSVAGFCAAGATT